MARTFRVHVIIPSEFRVALVVTLRLFEMFARFFFVILLFFFLFLFSFLSFFHFVRTESRVGSIRSLKRGHVFEGMWFVLFEGIFYSKQLRRKWFPSRVGSFIPVYFIFSIDYFFSFFFYRLPCVPRFYYSSRSGTIIEKVEKIAS